MAFNIDDYVDVATRLQEFYDRYPQGSVCTRDVEILEAGVLAIADAYRTPDDPHPGRGTAWEPVPGKTQFTRDSEVQNAETAAWGRAIIAVGIPSKKIASAEEVRARRDLQTLAEQPPKPARRAKGSASPTPAAAALTNQQKRIVIAATQAGIDDALRHRITRMLTGHTSAKDVPDEKCEQVAQNLAWFADNQTAALRELEAWEQKNGIEAAA